MLRVENLSLTYKGKKLVDNLSFSVADGEVLGIIGPSGSGKSLTARACLNLLPKNIYRKGTVAYEGFSSKEISLVLQNPLEALNPIMKIGKQIDEVTKNPKKSIALLKELSFDSPEKCYQLYPHEMSGGMRQRVVLAIALAQAPKLLFLDESTSSLDCIVQLDFLKKLKKINKEKGMAMVLITHDYRLVSYLCSRVVVIDKGREIEEGSCEKILKHPEQKMTQKLVAACQAF